MSKKIKGKLFKFQKNMNVQGTAVFALQVHSHEVVPYDATP